MFVNGCYIQILVLTLNVLLFSIQYAICAPKEREDRHLFPLLGYLHGYKIGQNFAYQLPPLVLSPVVILPSVNQQQSVNVQKSTSGESYQENGGTFQIISPSKLIYNITEANYTDTEMKRAEIEQSSKEDILEKTNLPEKTTNITNSDLDTFRQIVTNDTDATTVKTIEIDKENTTTIITNITNGEVENLKVTTLLHGQYPTAVYKNENISTLSITTASLEESPTSPFPILQQNLTLPNMKNNQNFKDNKIEQESNPSNVDEQPNGALGNSNIYPAITVSSSFRGYSYPNPWYSPVADKLSLTTNSYTNYQSRLPSAYDDRWQSFSSLRKSYPTSDFRPLAGLYHDGFLHKHLIKKTGFIPLDNKYSYYN